MGQISQKQLKAYELIRTQGNLSYLKKNIINQQEQMFIMKTYTSTSFQTHVQKLKQIKKYKLFMMDNQQLIKITHCIQEKKQIFCSTQFKLHTVYSFSDCNLESIIKQKQKQIILAKNLSKVDEIYFKYEDLCNIFYSCLTALWTAKQITLNYACDIELQQFSTIFLRTNDILVLKDGILKIIDPFLFEFSHRYVPQKGIYYSPQKIKDFSLVDDEKCAIFQLGMTLLKISLLQQLDMLYQPYQINAINLKTKIKQTKLIYKKDIQNMRGINIFQIIEKMLQIDRQDRLTLEQTIKRAQLMYEKYHILSQEINSQIQVQNEEKIMKICKTNRKINMKNDFMVDFTAQKQPRTNCTNNSTRSYKNKFLHFKNTLVNSCKQTKSQILIEDFVEQSSDDEPSISNFTIVETQPEHQQSKILSNQGIFNEIQSSILQKKNIFFSQKQKQLEQNKQNKQKQSIFTDPSLLNIITQQLRQIKKRKQMRQSIMISLQQQMMFRRLY